LTVSLDRRDRATIEPGRAGDYHKLGEHEDRAGEAGDRSREHEHENRRQAASRETPGGGDAHAVLR
jgi:hypothetical protein